jgi:predicted MFS family arabinose efflux permease
MEPLLGKVRNPLRNTFHQFEPQVWVMAAVQLVMATGFSICIPFLALYLHQDRGLSMTLVGLIILGAGLCSAVTQAFGGALSDRFGRRPILIMASSISIFLYSGLAVLIGISAPVWAIAIAYVAGRAMLTIARPVISAMVADFTSKEKLTEAYGILRIGGNMGWASHWVSRSAGLRDVLPPAEDRVFLAFIALSVLLFIAMGQMASTLSIFTVDMIGFSKAQFGLLLTLNGLIVIFFQYPMTLALRRVAKFRALILGSLLYVFGYLSLGWITQFGWALVAMAVITGGEIIHAPVSLSVIAELSPEDQRGRYMGLFGLSQTMGIAIGPLVGGLLLDAFPLNPELVWAPIASIALIAALGYYWWGRRFRQ